MTFTFHNVRVVIEAETGEEAYVQLCNLLAAIPDTKEAEGWQTDTYSIDESYDLRPTEEIWPK
jgi:hypothetical protein